MANSASHRLAVALLTLWLTTAACTSMAQSCSYFPADCPTQDPTVLGTPDDSLSRMGNPLLPREITMENRLRTLCTHLMQQIADKEGWDMVELDDAASAGARDENQNVLAYDRRRQIAADYVPLDELLPLSDIVTLHTPLNAETYHLLDRRHIEQMKRGAYIINTGRGSLVDTEALILALESGRLGGAALDVLEGEEGIFYADCRSGLVQNKLLLRLQELPNVLISPHTAYYTDHALSDTVENSIINCRKFESRNHCG